MCKCHLFLGQNVLLMEPYRRENSMIKKLIVLLLILLSLTAPACAETLRLCGVAEPKAFTDAHPEVAFIHADPSTQTYATTAEFSAPMLTREFNWDVFTMYTDKADAHLLMEKGYLLDLSGSEVIRDAVARMHPAIAEQCMYNGKIYAVPAYFRVEDNAVLMISPDGWAEAGYTLEDIPHSYPAFLDLLEDFLTRRENDPNLTVNVSNQIDDYLYGPEKYARWMVGLLLDNHIAQTLHAGEALRFDDPALASLLERTLAICERIYALEPTKSEGYAGEPALFSSHMGLSLDWLALQQYHVDLRLREDQPTLITCFMTLTAVSAATENPALAVELVEGTLGEIWPYADVLLYTDAEPIVNPDYETSIRDLQNMLALIDRLLADDHTPYTDYFDLNVSSQTLTHYPAVVANFETMDAWELLERRDYFERGLERESPYHFPPEQLAAYQTFAPGLYIPGPTVFDTSSDSSSNFFKLTRQLTDGLISAHEFCQQADRIAWMMAMENQ